MSLYDYRNNYINYIIDIIGNGYKEEDNHIYIPESRENEDEVFEEEQENENIFHEIVENSFTSLDEKLQTKIKEEIECDICFEQYNNEINQKTLINICEHIVCSKCCKKLNKCLYCKREIESTSVNILFVHNVVKN